jgi:cysteinyl-tRNA synthetase
MGLVVYNTMTREKETFVPIRGNRVNFYACGVTVYDLCHIGHARSLITFDVIYRYLIVKGYDVRFARNFTDVDDKIIARANERGLAWDAVAKTYIDEFYVDVDALGVRRPTLEPKATDFIPQIVAMVEALVKGGHAYVRDGDVYYAVKSFKPYGKLASKNLDELEAGARVAVGDKKRHPGDFALWKASKPGEPSWPSPWGPGRPGWHIECSAMSTTLLGASLDIHGGGKDLVFPHHENEIAQSEAATGLPFVKYWVHNGFVNVDHEKMSKSLGNFFTIRDVLAKFPPEVVRHFLLGTHYRNPIDYTDHYLRDAEVAVDRLYTAWEAMDAALAGSDATAPEDEVGLTDAEGRIWFDIGRHREGFAEAMDDDFNTPRALAHQFDLVRIINTLAVTEKGAAYPGRLGLLAAARAAFLWMNEVLGSLIRPPADYRAAVATLRLAGKGMTPERIAELIAARARARSEKDFAEADRVRQELAAAGVVLKDGKDGTTWSVG